LRPAFSRRFALFQHAFFIIQIKPNVKALASYVRDSVKWSYRRSLHSAQNLAFGRHEQDERDRELNSKPAFPRRIFHSAPTGPLLDPENDHGGFFAKKLYFLLKFSYNPFNMVCIF
jgi:hypothetical protein